MRIGIDNPGHRDLVTTYVLGKTSIADKQQINQAIDNAVAVSEWIIKGDIAAAMNQLHSR